MEIKMATAKVSGVDYGVPPNVKSSGAVNNRGTVTRGGSLASGQLTNVRVSRYNTTVFASTVLDNSWANKAVNGGTFAYGDRDGVGMRYTSTLAGVSNNALRSGADVPSLTRSIHKHEVFRTTKTASGIRANKYNRYTGQWDGGYPQVVTDTPGTDTAANPSRTSPGQLVYKLGQPVPILNNDYKAKTG
jgi:hypothetical protein